MGSAGLIEQLRDRLEQLQSAGPRARGPGVIATGWDDLDRAMGGLRAGVIHEWFSACEGGGLSGGGAGARREGLPPLRVLTHLAARAVEAACPQGDGGGFSGGGVVTWIGRSCWPHPPTLATRRGFLERSIFVDDTDAATRLWAIDLALRSPAVAAVVADGRGLDMSASRRLQLAAGANPRAALGLLARPMRDLNELSAAATRWVTRPLPTTGDHPRWSVELLRCKGERPDPHAPREWVLEGCDATGVVLVSAGVVDRPGAAAGPRPAPGARGGRARRSSA